MRAYCRVCHAALLFLHISPLFILLSFLLPPVGAAPENRTIDDTLGDSVTGVRPVYIPSFGVWEDSTCKGCAIQPDPAQAFDGTWTAGTYNPNIPEMGVQLSFQGTAIYIFFILANDQGPGITTLTETNFTLDGTLVGHFLHNETVGTDLLYNQLAFSQTNLQFTNHTLLISTQNVPYNVFVNFDYAIYTVPNNGASSTSGSNPTSTLQTVAQTHTSAPSSQGLKSSSLSTPAIVGIVVGALVGILGAIAALFFWRLRRKNQYTDRRPISIIESSEVGHQYGYGHGRGPSTDAYTAYQSEYGDTAITPFISSTSGPVSRSSYPDLSHSGSSGPRTHSSSPSQTGLISAYGADGTAPTSAFTGSSFAVQNPSLSDGVSSVGVPPIPPIPGDAGVAAVRRARQQELERQMRQIKEELKHLRTEEVARRASLPIKRPGGPQDDDTELRELRDRVRIMTEQIAFLRNQTTSAWAMGETDEPLPSYTPSARSD